MFNRKLSTITLATMTLALSACAPLATTTPPLPSAQPSTPAAVGSAQPSPGTTPAPGVSATPSTPASPGATPTAPANPGEPIVLNPVVIAGMIYDEEGAPVDDALITIKSLSGAAPYNATATSQDGSWVVNNVPEGVNVEIVASKAGWTSRRRVGSFQASSSERRSVDFGASNGQTNPGAAYFLSNSPEITSTEPATKAIGQDPSQLTYKLVLSEPLAENARKRFEDAIRVFPANEAASPDGIAGNHADLESVADSPAINIDTAYQYTIKKGTIFLEDTATAAKVAWNAAGTEATVTFVAPVIAAKNSEAKYQIGLVRPSGSDPAIKDAEGKQLGTDELGSRTAYPAGAGELIRNAFREPDLALEGTITTADQRWNATHESVATFKVKRDDLTPKLLGVAVNDIGNDLRIELSFSEAMVAFNGTNGGFSHPSLINLANYTFAIGEKASDLTGVDLDGDLPGSAPLADPVADATFGDAAGDDEREFTLTGGDADSDRADTGDIYIEADSRDAKKVFITIVGRKGWFDADMNAIKARVEKVADPAGNAINDTEADRNQVAGDL